MGAGTPTGGMPQQSQSFGGQASNLYPPPPQPGMSNPSSQTAGQGMSQTYSNPYAPQQSQSQSQQAPNYLSQLYNTYGQGQQFAAQSAPPMQPQGMMPPQPLTGGPGQQQYPNPYEQQRQSLEQQRQSLEQQRQNANQGFLDQYSPYGPGNPGLPGPDMQPLTGGPGAYQMDPRTGLPYYGDYNSDGTMQEVGSTRSPDMQPLTGGPGAYQMDPRTGLPYYGDYNSDGTMQEVGSTRSPDMQPLTGGPMQPQGMLPAQPLTGGPMQPLTGGLGQQQNPYQNPYQDFSPTAVQAQDQLQQMLARQRGQAGQQSGLGALQQHYGFAIDPYMPPPPPPPPVVAPPPPPVVAPRPPPPQQQRQEEYDPGPDRYQQYLQNNPDVAREYTGNTSAYGDYNHDGTMDVKDIVEGHYGQYGQEEGRAAYRRGGLAALRYR